jgi:hypothetical protein
VHLIHTRVALREGALDDLDRRDGRPHFGCHVGEREQAARSFADPSAGSGPPTTISGTPGSRVFGRTSRQGMSGENEVGCNDRASTVAAQDRPDAAAASGCQSVHPPT